MTRMNEILDKPYRDNGAYRVPEGYFSNLNKRIMDALPEEQKQRKGRHITLRLRFRYAAAACMAGLIVGFGAFFIHNGNDAGTAALAASEAQNDVITDDYVKECMDYAMVDDNDIYTYLAEQQ